MTRHLQFERLEDRVLLTVNIVQRGGTLFLTGDNAGDDVRLEGTGAMGEMYVSVNGGAAVLHTGVRNINARFGSGDNDLNLDGVQIGGNLVANMGLGNDEVDIDNDSAMAGDAFPVFIGGSVILNLGGQMEDFVEFDTDGGAEDGITIGRHLIINGAADIDLDGDGGSSDSESDDINIGGNLLITSRTALDFDGDGFTVQLEDCNVGGAVIMNLGNDEDLVAIGHSSFGSNVSISLGGGDDTLDIDSSGDSNLFARRLTVNGGLGLDTFDTDAGNVLVTPATLRNLETFL